NPYMVYVLQRSDATTLSGLISDLNAAHDYSAYVANPLAFDASLVMSGDPNQLATWQTELTRIHALGLDQLTNVQILSIETFGSIVSITPTYLAQNAALMGTSYNFFNQGEQDCFTRLATGQLVAWGFNPAGTPLFAQALIYTNASPFAFPPGTQLIGTG